MKSLLSFLIFTIFLLINVGSTFRDRINDPIREETIRALEILRSTRAAPVEARRVLRCILFSPHHMFEKCVNPVNILLETKSRHQPPLSIGLKNGLFSPGIVRTEGPTLDIRSSDPLGSRIRSEHENLVKSHEDDIPDVEHIDEIDEIPENVRIEAKENAEHSFTPTPTPSDSSISRSTSGAKKNTREIERSSQTDESSTEESVMTKYSSSEPLKTEKKSSEGRTKTSRRESRRYQYSSS